MTGLQSDYDHGIALLDAGDFVAALAILQKVSKAIPGNEQILRALRRLGHEAAGAAMALPIASDEALDFYQAALAAYLAMGRTITDPHDRALLRAVCFNIGAHYHGHKRYDLAIQHYRDALLLGPEYSDTPTNLAGALTESGRAEEAIEILDAALRYHPEMPQLKYQMAMALEAAEKGTKGSHSRA
jgi:tetratricopeptide (TPR) repeat protein